ncbi:MAG: hypothetical protein K2Q22_13010, partial [Cytophagales bacterium]|nr:hypothetical protein [Cytophagales bacterium]
MLYYPGFAERYIPGIKTTKGAIHTLHDFLESTNKGLQPSLTNPFKGRDEEIKKSKDLLTIQDVLVLTGAPGVGKSKLAVYLAELFEQENQFETRVIVGSPVPIWDDLTSFLLPDKKYFIVFDDANKAILNLDYLMQFIRSRDVNTIKVVITVRDYVRRDLDVALLDQKFREVALDKLEDKQIEEIVNTKLPQGHFFEPYVLERILSLSKGNSRLALMAATAIIANKDIEVLRNATQLYDEYFKKIVSEVSFLTKPDYLKALGILSFFGVLEKSNRELAQIIEENFEVNWDQIWEIFIDLEKLELVDVFVREAAKISDQVLATYVFYKAFIDEKTCVISYPKWITKFIGKYDKKINKSLIDIINTFGFNELKDRVGSLIVESQKALEKNDDLTYKFFHSFWFYKEFDTLIYIKKWIDELDGEEIEPDKINFSFKTNDFVWPTKYMDLLINFWHHATPFTKMGLEVGLSLAFKRPTQIPELLKHLSDHIAYQRYDYNNGFFRQHLLVNILTETDHTESETFILDQFFLTIAPSFLGWEYTQVESAGDGQMRIFNFELRKTPELIELRKKILIRVFELFYSNQLVVIGILGKYIWITPEFDSSIYEDEQSLISDFCRGNFSITEYAHCKFIKEYEIMLKKRSIPVSLDWSDFIQSDIMKVADIFSYKLDRFDFQKQEDEKKTEIKSILASKDFDYLKEILSCLEKIQKSN